jgi:hypothetical protein
MGLCYTRKIAVLQQLNKDFNKWMQDSIRYGYTDGWMAGRICIFIKRMFGEYVSARKYPNMAKEFML